LAVRELTVMLWLAWTDSNMLARPAA